MLPKEVLPTDLHRRTTTKNLLSFFAAEVQPGQRTVAQNTSAPSFVSLIFLRLFTTFHFLLLYCFLPSRASATRRPATLLFRLAGTLVAQITRAWGDCGPVKCSKRAIRSR